MALGSMVAPLLAVAGFPIRWAAVGLIRLMKPVAEPALYLYARVSPEGDRRLLVRPEFKAMFLDDLLNGSRKQMAAPFADVIVFARDWGFRLDAGEDPGPLVARRPRPHRAVRAWAACRRAGCPTRSCTHCPGRAISPGWALPRKFCTPWSSSGTASRRGDFLVSTHTVAVGVIHGASARKTAAHQRSTQLVHRRAAGLDDGRLRLLPRRAGLRRHREDLPPHQGPKSRS